MKTSKIAAVTCSLIAAASLAACGSSGSQSQPSASSSASANSMNQDGVSYQYPADWTVFPTASNAAQTGNQLWGQNVGPSGTSLAQISSYQLQAEVTFDNLEEVQPQIEDTVAQLAANAGGSVTSPIQPETTAGLPGYTGRVQVKGPDGTTLNSSLWFFFRGTTEYFINCQYVADTETQMLEGCQLIRNTFKINS